MKEANDQLYQQQITKAMSERLLCPPDETIYSPEGDDFGGLYEYEAISKRLLPRIVNPKCNKDLDKTVPCVLLEEQGLLVIFYVDLCIRNDAHIRFVVTNHHLLLWEVSRDTVIRTALHNLCETK